MIEKTYKICSYDIFQNGYVKLSSLQKYMQQAAREDCDSYGATYQAMRDTNTVFVITKLMIEFYDIIKSDDIILLKSINNKIEGISYYREFLLYSAEKLVGASTTHWVLMDFAARRVVRPSRLQFDVPALNLDIKSIPDKRHLAPKGIVFPHKSIHGVRYSELDENNHMNNAVYADLMYDYAPVDVHDLYLKKCQINFYGEAALGDKLELSSITTEKGFIMSAGNLTTQKQCFEAEAEF